MRFANLLSLFFLLAFGLQVSAQRYLTPQFTSASSTVRIYGFNYTVLPLIQPGAHTQKQPLQTVIYTPVGDTETERPLVIYLHTGNFFPYPLNGSCGGTLQDSACVEFAERLTSLGYVVAVTTYRQGWNPFSTVELVRRATLINAAYRGVQDVSTAIRFFRKTVAEEGNPYGIDPDKIVVWGQGTGGYLSLASAYLNAFGDIYTTSDPNKFRLPLPNGTLYPMVQESYNGDLYGTTGPTIVDATYNAIFTIPIGDTLCIPNHQGYASNFHLAVNMGGALGDSTWMDKGDVPLISYHVPSDFFAPCGTDVLNVPTQTGPQPVVEVSGSCDMQVYAQNYGNNDIFKTIPAGNDPYGAIAKTINGGLDGFYPFYGTPDDSSSPWEWTTIPPSPADCNTDGSSARTYIDTVIGYFAPRACVALGLGCQFSSIKELDEASVELNVAPVPAADVVNITANELIREVYVYDLSGRVVKSNTAIDNYSFQVQRNNLNAGLYIAEIRFDKGFVKRKIVFSN